MMLMDANAPRISILFPVHNAEKYLATAIESILNQTFSDFILIAVDDGSTDKSNAILKYYLSIDPRIILIEQKNAGIVLALNNALYFAKSEFCARMDADDVSIADRFSAQVEYLEKHKDVIAVGGQGYLIDDEGYPIRPLTVELDHLHIDTSLIKARNVKGIIHPSVMFRTAVAQKIGGYREQFPWAEDLDFFLRMAEQGKLANLDKCVIYYRKHGSSVSDSYKYQQQVSAENAISEALIRRGLPRQDRKYPKTVRSAPSTVIDYHIEIAYSAASHRNRGTLIRHIKLAFLKSPLCFKVWRVILATTLPKFFVLKIRHLLSILR